MAASRARRGRAGGARTAPRRSQAKLGALVSRGEAGKRYVIVPTLVLSLLQHHGALHLVDAWTRLAHILWERRSEQERLGGLRPMDLIGDLREERGRATRYEHLAELEALGLLERTPVKGLPRRGPGTRIHYRLPHRHRETSRPAGERINMLRERISARAAAGDSPQQIITAVSATIERETQEGRAIRPGDIIDPALIRRTGHVRVPHFLLSLLAAQRAHHLIAIWSALSRYTWRHNTEQRTRRGLMPCVLIAQLDPHLSRSATYRQLADLEALGLLERTPVKGLPRRGLGTRVRFWLKHALWRTPREDSADTGIEHTHEAPQTAHLDGPDDSRGPPDLTPAQLAAGLRAGLAIVKNLRRDHH